MPVKIVVCQDADELAQRGADEIVRIARESIEASGQFSIALSGGSTPEKMYALLNQPDQATRIDWARWRVYFGDERFVPAADEQRSNLAMARRSLFAAGRIPAENIFAFDATMPTVQQSALAYERTLVDRLGKPPIFDLILLGMGEDGHTASLFPHAATLDVQNRFVVDSPPGILPPPVDRMTATIGLLKHARNTLLLAGGQTKAAALHEVLDESASVDDHPVAAILQNVGNVTIMLDQAAASLLSDSTVRKHA